MQYDDLKFTITDPLTNQEIECNILSLIPKNQELSYVVYLDQSKDENGNAIFKYGKLIKEGNDYSLHSGCTNEEIEFIKKKFHEDLIDFAKNIVKE